MSHFSRIQTQIIDKRLLLQALKDLGYRYEEGELQLPGFAAQQTPVEIRIQLPLSYDIGFRKVGDTYEAVADWSGVRGIQSTDFINQVSQRYAYHATKEKLELQGFTLVEEQVQDTGQIRLLLRRME